MIKKKDTKSEDSPKPSNSKQVSDTIIPEDQYTCKAPEEPEPDNSADFIKCFSCEGEGKSASKCKAAPNNDTSTTIRCNSKSQKCYTKALYNQAKNGELTSFTRGCASVSDLEPESASSKADKIENDKVSCQKKSGNVNSCIQVCESSLCNTISELKSKANKNILSNGILIYSIVILVIKISSFIHL